MSSSSSCQQEQLKAELARLKSQAKNLRRRQRRQEAKQQQAAASPSVTKDVLMVFVLSGHRPEVAAEYANRRSQHSARETSQEARDELEALIEQAYIDTDVDDLASMFDIASSSPQWVLAYRAAKQCVDQKLFEHIVEQNCKKGVAACRIFWLAKHCRQFQQEPLCRSETSSAASSVVRHAACENGLPLFGNAGGTNRQTRSAPAP